MDRNACLSANDEMLEALCVEFKRSTLTDAFRDQITLSVLRLKEGGLLHTLHQRWWIEKGQCGSDSGRARSSSKVIQLHSYYLRAIHFVLEDIMCV